MGVCVHESRHKRGVAQIDHLRVAWYSQITANIDNPIALNDNDAILNK